MLFRLKAGLRTLVTLALVGILAISATAEPFHFAYDIAPILAKSGCSAAECHGGAAGKGGFKLSLFSSDPKADFAAITRELGARRIDLVEPDRSLFLRKPSKQIKHGGGRVLKPDEPAFEALHNWIDTGAPWAAGGPLELTGLRLELSGDAVAVFADFEGAERDVTALTMLESTDAGVASIDELGQISRNGPGEAWILARYGNLNARAPILTPFGPPTATDEPAHPLDRIWRARLSALGLAPSDRAADFVLRRRLYLDLAGRPPSPLELARPLEIDQLLQTDDFAQNWARKAANWFEVPIAERDPNNSSEAHGALRDFFLTSIRIGDSAAEIARRILIEPSPGRAWTRFPDPRDRAEFVGRSMLGMRIECARCHNHPLDRWKQDEHLRFSAFFSDERPNADGPGMMAGRFFEPETGREVQPALLPLGTGQPETSATRKEQLAWFVLDAGHDQFARNIANRVFGELTGQPLVDSPDDHRLSNPATHQQLLDLLTEELVAADYDLRALIRFIATSELYALSSEGSSNPAALKYLARRDARRLSLEEFRRVAGFVTGVETGERLPPESPLAEQLFVLNSGLIQKSLATPGNQIDAIFDFGADAEAQLRDLFELILSRPPTDEERAAFLPDLKGVAAGRNLAFALLASREFGSIR